MCFRAFDVESMRMSASLQPERSDEPPLDLASIGPDLFLLHDGQGNVVHAGVNAGRVLGVDASILYGAGFLEAVHVQDRVGIAKAIGDCLARQMARKAQFRLAGAKVATTGEARWFELRCEPAETIAEHSGQTTVLSVVRDVSQRRKLESELRLEREKADSANVAKSRFLASMSHELRTPLNAILGFSELLQSDVMQSMPAERSREYVALIHNSATHLLNVLNDILDMSKIEAGKYEIVTEPFDLAGTLQSSAAILRGQADQRGIAIRTACDGNLPEITADKRAIKQIMINLISNAVKFSHDGGDVRVTTRRVGRNVEIEVADDGIGISAEHLQQLGVPFYQADSRYDRKYEGTGLGLSVVRGLVELHNGKLGFRSVKNGGTTVTITLPLVPPHHKPVPAPEDVEIIRLSDMPEAAGRGPSRKTA